MDLLSSVPADALAPSWVYAILLGGWFGLVHALDADHVATIGGLAIGNRSLTPVGYALRWALGHAAALGLVALAVLALGAADLLAWTSYAEILVCVALLLIGLNALRTLLRRRAASAASREHARERAEPHVHFLAPFHAHGRSGRAGVLLGALHGTAGSAAVLALLPLAQFHSGVAGALYLATFSVGVGIGALAFARVLAACAVRTAALGERIAAAFHALVAGSALAAAAWLALEIVHGGG